MRVDPNYLVNLTQAAGVSSLTEQKLTTELSSGLRVTTLSDDPVAAAQNVLLASQISSNDSFTLTSSREQNVLQATDSTLGEVVSSVTQAISLSVQANSGTLNPANLTAIGAQLSGIRDQVLSLANTAYLGTYLFSGSKGGTPPFTLATSTTPPTVTYQGDAITQSITTPGLQKIQVNVAGSDIFTAPGADLLGALNQVVSDVQSGVTTNLAADTAALTTALGNVTTQRAVLGTSLSRLTTASSYSATQEGVLKAQQSSLLSSDTAAVATGLQTAEVQHTALLNVIAGLDKTNLFDYLH
jgi:flagellar hook-associated protein 3 FlgL